VVDTRGKEFSIYSARATFCNCVITFLLGYSFGLLWAGISHKIMHKYIWNYSVVPRIDIRLFSTFVEPSL
jgi:membrane protein DedA with SNARE-associated domain